MKLSDEMLEKAAEQVCTTLAASVPDPEAQDGTFSPEFEAKMARLIKKERHMAALGKFARNAAACLLALLICAGTWLAIDTETRAASLNWLKESLYRGGARYEFDNEGSDMPLAEYALSSLPEGYRLTISSKETEVHLKMYEGDGMPLMLKYCKMVESQNFGISSYVWEAPFHSTSVTVNGLQIDCYVSGNANSPNILVWLDPNTETAFILSGLFPSEELLVYAESVRPVK